MDDGDDHTNEGLEHLSGDEIGPWSETKLEILRKYAAAYSVVVASQPYRFEHYYLDAFAGGGTHLSEATGQVVRGSPLNALDVQPPFKHYFFVDLDEGKTDALHQHTAGRDNVTIVTADSNKILIEQIIPAIRYAEYKRALCFLDPYTLQLRWQVIEAAGRAHSIEIFLNFFEFTQFNERSPEQICSHWKDNLLIFYER